MNHTFVKSAVLPVAVLLTSLYTFAQDNLRPRFNNSSIYTGIEVGSKGVKMSIIEVGNNAKSTGAFNILKDTSSNTDFISFTDASFSATLQGLYGLYTRANKEYKIPAKRIFTVISSGVKMQAEKEDKNAFVKNLIDSFRILINEPNRKVEVVDVVKEARLSHLGIVPDARRYTTFLLDIGSGNTKGGFFPGGNTDNFRLFEINWGTKSTANATEKRCDGDISLPNFNKQLQRVLYTAENPEIIYAVNASGAYPLSDNIAVSGGIAWAIATLMRPEMVDNSVISVNYDEVVNFMNKILEDYPSISADALAAKGANDTEKAAIRKAASTVHKVFDQRALLSGSGLLLKIMRQFVSEFETKQFFLIKNGQVGWVSAYVDQVVGD